MTRTIFIIHTSSVSVKELNDLFKELAPGIVVRNIIDDSLLPEVLTHGGITDSVRKRYRYYALAAVEGGACLIFNQCSSVREVAEEVTKDLPVRFISVDERMAEVACTTGKKIAVVATLRTTLGPTCRLIRRTAQQMNQEVDITEHLCEGAFDKLIAGDRKTHNEMVLAAIGELVTQADVVVCAQGSMTALLPELGQTRVPVLTSPRLGVQKAVEILSKI